MQLPSIDSCWHCGHVGVPSRFHAHWSGTRLKTHTRPLSITGPCIWGPKAIQSRAHAQSLNTQTQEQQKPLRRAVAAKHRARMRRRHQHGITTLLASTLHHKCDHAGGTLSTGASGTASRASTACSRAAATTAGAQAWSQQIRHVLVPMDCTELHQARECVCETQRETPTDMSPCDKGSQREAACT